MTLTEAPAEKPAVDEAQLLFPEAKQRRKRRWLVSGIVAVIGVLLVGAIVGVALGRGGKDSLSPRTVPPIAGASFLTASDFSLRPVLCIAPPVAATPVPGGASSALPACAAPSALTAANLQVSPDLSNADGYTSNLNQVPVDSHFAAYPSTESVDDTPGATVLLPGPDGAQGSVRYVLGPAGLTGNSVRSADARLESGQWVVNITLTGSGSATWDALAYQQFHALVGVVVDNRVISVPITEPTQSAFSSFSGELNVAGGLTEHQAKALAARL